MKVKAKQTNKETNKKTLKSLYPFATNTKIKVFVWGMIAALISVLLTILYFWFTVVVLGLDFYIMPPV